MPRRTGIHHSAVVGRHPETREHVADDSLTFIDPQIDPSAYVQPFVTVDAGVHIQTRVGARTLIMTKAHVGHDCEIGDDVEIGSGAVLGGHCRIGHGAKIGIGAVILPYRTIGAGSRIGAGSVVTKDVEPGATVCGNPAKAIMPNTTPYTQRGLDNDLNE